MVAHFTMHNAHIWCKSGISICWRHLVTSKESSNPIFFFGRRPCLHHTCATWDEQPSNIKTMTRPKFVTASKTYISYTHQILIYIYNSPHIIVVYFRVCAILSYPLIQVSRFYQSIFSSIKVKWLELLFSSLFAVL